MRAPGDAAHVWAPVGGHGMNAGMRGAHNLAWKLAAVVRGEAPAALLDTYSDEQRAAIEQMAGQIAINTGTIEELERRLAQPRSGPVETDLRPVIRKIWLRAFLTCLAVVGTAAGVGLWLLR